MTGFKAPDGHFAPVRRKSLQGPCIIVREGPVSNGYALSLPSENAIWHWNFTNCLMYETF